MLITKIYDSKTPITQKSPNFNNNHIYRYQVITNNEINTTFSYIRNRSKPVIELFIKSFNCIFSEVV